MFIKRGDGKILNVEQDSSSEEVRKANIKKGSESIKPSEQNKDKKSGS